MAESQPSVYVLNGDDDFAIAGFLAGLQNSLGDPATAGMNTARLDGRSLALNDLSLAVNTLPFLAPRRLVIVTHPLAFMSTQAMREKATSLLEKTPPTTTVALVEHRLLTEERERKTGSVNWLEKWAVSAGERVALRTFSVPHGAAMTAWILERAKHHGGQFTPQAAEQLIRLIGDEPRLADQEIQKLLAYANYSRPVSPEDVENLTVFAREGDIFAMVDALGNRDGKKAQALLHHLLSEQDALSIMGMVVRQFRLLLQAREMVERRAQEWEIARDLKLHPFVAGKVSAQARKFSLETLETIHRYLLEIDEAIKTSQMDDVLALDVFIAQRCFA